MKFRKLLSLLLVIFCTSSMLWADTEPDNDTPAGADNLSLDVPENGTLNFAGDLVDYYAFTTTDDGQINLSMTGDVNYLTIQILDADGTTILGTTTNYAPLSISVSNLAAGNYYASIVAYAAYSGNYALTATVTPANFANDSEPNDTYTNALTLAENGSANGHIGYRNNGGSYDTDDWYSVTTTSDGTITATFTNETGKYNTIYIYDNDGTTILGSQSAYSSGSISVYGKAAGTYYIRLHYYAPVHFNAYTISNTVTPTALANDTEPNNVFAETNTTIPENGSVTGHIGHRANGGVFDTDDWYVINLSQDGQLVLNLHQDLGMYHGLYLYDNDGTTILTSDFNYTNVTITKNNLSAGTYYAKVDNYSTVYYSGYTLECVVTPTAYANDAEPNDIYTEATTAIPVGGTVNGHIGFYENGGGYDTDDWYTFTTTEDGAVTLTLNQPLGVYHGIYMYDNNGTTIISSDFNYTTTTITVNNLAAGDYYAKVDNYSSTYYSSYSLSLSVTPPPYANDPEPNGTIETASPMLTNSTVDGHIGYRNNGTIYDQNDYYEIILSEPGDLTLSIAKGPSQYNSIYILNNAGTSLASGSNYGNFSITKTDLAAGTYYALVHYYSTTHFGGYTLTNNYCPDQITIIAEGETTFCDGESITLSTPDHHLNYLWSDGSVTETNTVTLSGDQYLTIDNGGGCVRVSNTITTESTPLPVAIIEADGPTEFCAGGSVTLSVPAVADSYLWNTGETTASITVDATGDYSVVLTKNDCSAISDPLHITVYALPDATITADGSTTFCDGGSVTLMSSPGTTYAWTTGETTDAITVTSGGDYAVTVFNAYGCSSTSALTSVTVNSNPIAEISADGPTTFCTGGSVSLFATGGTSYLWNTGATTASILVTESGMYSATVYNAAGCSDNTTTIEVVVEPCATVTISADGPVTFCDGGSVTLTSSELTGNVWNTGETTQSIVVTSGGDYYCINAGNTSNIISVFVNNNPVAGITADGETTFCAGESVGLNASAASSYVWNTGETTPSIVVETTGDYSVTITDENGCSATSDATTVTVNPIPDPTISADGPVVFCGADVTLNTDGEYDSYLWNTGETTPSITTSTTGDYAVTVEQAGCAGTSNTIHVEATAAPTVSIASDGPVICLESSVMLTATTDATNIQWQRNGEDIPGATDAVYYASIKGKYRAVVSTGDCEAISDDIKLKYIERLTITPSGTVGLCGGEVMMSASFVAGASYQWYKGNVAIDGATSSTYTTTVKGKFYCIATKDDCSTVTSALIVTEGCREGEIIAAEMVLMPNPAADYFEIVFSAAQSDDAVLRITTISGSVVASEVITTTPGEQTVYYATDQLPSGAYLVSLQLADGTQMYQTLIVEK